MSQPTTRYMIFSHAELPTELEVTTLRDEPSGGPRTLLVHIPPGGRIEPHAHVAPVQHLVLAGSYEIDGDILDAGTYRLYPDHTSLPEITSKDGASILMIFDPVT